jgi:hypothetical protein
MINKIDTVDDVKTFFNELNQESLNFHPDSDFTDYVNVETNEATYNIEEAQVRNDLLDFHKEFPKEI